MHTIDVCMALFMGKQVTALNLWPGETDSRMNMETESPA
ncbi:hypothetical protein B4099_2888 [Heyndrickxia coagulans]|uniref:Uncharacterized protein n=1 Tax=Heyndrickxia coagulans TaxID=1398 RepID=A0A150K1C7_HEYCO|nr:hypothetical protein B4099_2888 [Heyndrickxia coagulans]